jgi:flagellar motor switch protein FliN/FliY
MAEKESVPKEGAVNTARQEAPQGKGEAPEAHRKAAIRETVETEAKPVNFDPLVEEKPAPASSENLEFVLDIPLRISVQLGSARMVIKDLLQLGQGSVIELEKLAGEPLEVLVNDKLVARGEVVVVNEKFGVRLTDIVSPAERIKQLR